MPTCNDCGNERRFEYDVEGSETRITVGDEHLTTTDQRLETVGGPTCAECGSDDVSLTDDETKLEISEGGRYQNVFLGDAMVMSFDEETGELAVYDPYSDSEDPEYVMEGSP